MRWTGFFTGACFFVAYDVDYWGIKKKSPGAVVAYDRGFLEDKFQKTECISYYVM